MLIRDLEKRRGPIYVGAGRMGVLTWDVACAGDDGPFVLQVPLVLDEPGAARPREARRAPAERREHAPLHRARPEPVRRRAARLHDPGRRRPGGDVRRPARPPPDHLRPRARCRSSSPTASTPGSSRSARGATADLLAEMVAALAYHYDPDSDGGTAAHRRLGQRRRLRGQAAPRRHVRPPAHRRPPARRPASAPSLPAPLPDPDDGVRGLGRGRQPGRPADADRQPLGRLRGARARPALPLPRPRAGPRRTARARRRVDPRFRPLARGPRLPAVGGRFLAGRLPLSFGGDPRERWWRLVSLRTKLGILELRARQDPPSPEAASARALRTFVDRLSRQIGRAPGDDSRMPSASTISIAPRSSACSTRRRCPPARATTSPADDPRALAVPQPRPPAGRGAGRARPAPAEEPPLLRPRPRRR